MAGRGKPQLHGTAAGLEFCLALCSDGIAFAWGHGQDSQLGNGGTADSRFRSSSRA
jgi:alpha-tubulin suppressor-like RCC1 family protein